MMPIAHRRNIVDVESAIFGGVGGVCSAPRYLKRLWKGELMKVVRKFGFSICSRSNQKVKVQNERNVVDQGGQNQFVTLANVVDSS